MKILLWNIAGLMVKTGDVDWKSFLAIHHIALQEIWEPKDTYSLDGFVTFCKCAVPGRMGRASGGLLLLINLTFLYKATLIDTCSPNILAVELSGKYLPTLLVVNFYNSFTRMVELEHLNALVSFFANYADRSANFYNILVLGILMSTSVLPTV